jgi:acyl-CoA reductase-like NAD-dependent aldehyde dehydrogenase
LTVIADATDDMPVVKEEQFGPIVPVIKYHNLEQAIASANALEVGLGGSVWGDDPAAAADVAVRLECGTAWVNQHAGLHPMAPHSGVKSSGIGVEFNVDGLKEYTTIQVLSVAL